LKPLEILRNADRAAGNEYASDQIEIQRLAVAVWITHAKKKDNVAPGAIIPARELLGELLLELKRPGEVQKEFDASLQLTSNRRKGMR
jgi:hypothetical protein